MTCLKHCLLIGTTLILDIFMYVLGPFVFIFITAFPMNRLHSIDSVDIIESFWVSRWNPNLTEVNIFFLNYFEGSKFYPRFLSFCFCLQITFLQFCNSVFSIFNCIYSRILFTVQYVNQFFKFNSDIFKVEGWNYLGNYTFLWFCFKNRPIPPHRPPFHCLTDAIDTQVL